MTSLSEDLTGSGAARCVPIKEAIVLGGGMTFRKQFEARRSKPVATPTKSPEIISGKNQSQPTKSKPESQPEASLPSQPITSTLTVSKSDKAPIESQTPTTLPNWPIVSNLTVSKSVNAPLESKTPTHPRLVQSTPSTIDAGVTDIISTTGADKSLHADKSDGLPTRLNALTAIAQSSRSKMSSITANSELLDSGQASYSAGPNDDSAPSLAVHANTAPSAKSRSIGHKGSEQVSTESTTSELTLSDRKHQLSEKSESCSKLAAKDKQIVIISHLRDDELKNQEKPSTISERSVESCVPDSEQEQVSIGSVQSLQDPGGRQHILESASEQPNQSNDATQCQVVEPVMSDGELPTDSKAAFLTHRVDDSPVNQDRDADGAQLNEDFEANLLGDVEKSKSSFDKPGKFKKPKPRIDSLPKSEAVALESGVVDDEQVIEETVEPEKKQLEEDLEDGEILDSGEDSDENQCSYRERYRYRELDVFGRDLELREAYSKSDLRERKEALAALKLRTKPFPENQPSETNQPAEINQSLADGTNQSTAEGTNQSMAEGTNQSTEEVNRPTEKEVNETTNDSSSPDPGISQCRDKPTEYQLTGDSNQAAMETDENIMAGNSRDKMTVSTGSREEMETKIPEDPDIWDEVTTGIQVIKPQAIIPPPDPKHQSQNTNPVGKWRGWYNVWNNGPIPTTETDRSSSPDSWLPLKEPPKPAVFQPVYTLLVSQTPDQSLNTQAASAHGNPISNSAITSRSEVIVDDVIPSYNKTSELWNASSTARKNDSAAEQEVIASRDKRVMLDKTMSAQRASSTQPGIKDNNNHNKVKASATIAATPVKALDKAKLQRAIDIEKYKSLVDANKQDFNSWATLLTNIDHGDDVAASIELYDTFFFYYPYCYGYWRKYADFMSRFKSWSDAHQVYRRSVAAVPLSVDMWVSYLDFVLKSYKLEMISQQQVRRIFLQCIDTCGLDFKSDKLYDMYIEWETANQNYREITAIYKRLISTPTYCYKQHYENVKVHIDSHPLEALLNPKELRVLRDRASHLLKSMSDAKHRAERDGDKHKYKHKDRHYDKSSPHRSKSRNSTSERRESKEDRSRRGSKDDEKSRRDSKDEEKPLKGSKEDKKSMGDSKDDGEDSQRSTMNSPTLDAPLTPEEHRAVHIVLYNDFFNLHNANHLQVTKRRPYEEAVKRPYFHTKALDKSQIKNWRDYLNFEMSLPADSAAVHSVSSLVPTLRKGIQELNRVIVLFERCLIACAQYEEFWIKYCMYLESIGNLKAVRSVFNRACRQHLPYKASLHLVWAFFEERTGSPEAALSIICAIETTSPTNMCIINHKINLLRRSRNPTLDAVYMSYINEGVLEQEVRCIIACKYARYLHKLRNDIRGAEFMLLSTINLFPNEESLYMALLDIHYQTQPLDVAGVLGVFKQVQTSQYLTDASKLRFFNRHYEFLDELATDDANVLYSMYNNSEPTVAATTALTNGDPESADVNANTSNEDGKTSIQSQEKDEGSRKRSSDCETTSSESKRPKIDSSSSDEEVDFRLPSGMDLILPETTTLSLPKEPLQPLPATYIPQTYPGYSATGQAFNRTLSNTNSTNISQHQPDWSTASQQNAHWTGYNWMSQTSEQYNQYSTGYDNNGQPTAYWDGQQYQQYPQQYS